MAKKTNKRTVRREYTKDDVKELRAHSKARTPVVKLVKNYEAHRGVSCYRAETHVERVSEHMLREAAGP